MPKMIETRKNGTRRVCTMNYDAEITEQHHADHANINSIMARYHATGLVPQITQGGKYGDFSCACDYHESQNRIIEAQTQFSQLPSAIRNRFHNDPGELIEFVSNADNTTELIRMGLLPPESPETNATPPEVPSKAKTAQKGTQEPTEQGGVASA